MDRRLSSRTFGVILPRSERKPAHAIAIRLGLALSLVFLMTIVVYSDRGGYYDARGGEISFLDSLYYTTVSISTTGYGDIVPASDGARMLTALVMTPARLAFILILVGTTLQVLTERSTTAFRTDRWRKSLKDHTIVCGYGTKGRSVVTTLLGKGHKREQIVVIDRTETGIRDAQMNGLAIIQGDASRTSVLNEAEASKARAIVVAVDRDDAAVLTTLTARELNPFATISASVREQENVHLLRQSGADSVITSSDAAGHLLGMATSSPTVVKVLEDLFTAGSGLEMVERDVRPNEVGKMPVCTPTEIVVAISREGSVIPFNEKRALLQENDRLVTVVPHK